MTPAKSILLNASVLLALFVAIPAANGQSKAELSAIYKSAITAYQKGNYEAAEKGFTQVLRSIPNHAKSSNYLVKIKNKRRATAAIPAMKKSLAKVIIPKVSLDQISIEDALVYIQAQISEQTGGKISPNFILKPSVPEVRNRTITLIMTNIPASMLIDYAGKQAGLQFEYEPYAIVGTAHGVLAAQEQ